MITKKFSLKAEDYAKKIVIMGKSGSGKSYTARVVIEEGLKLGVTFTIVDPQDAYGNLPGFFYIQAKKVSNPKKLGILLATTSKNCVIGTQRMTIEEQQKFLKLMLEGFRQYKRKGIRSIVIDEAHKFAPEYDKSEAKDEMRAMSQEDRSSGLGLITIEQRPQRLDKTILSQADYLVIHKLSAFRDLKAVEAYLDDLNDLNKIKKLEVGSAYFYGFSDDPMIEKVRPSETEHTGSTPKDLLTEDNQTFHNHIGSIYRYGGNKMSDEVSTKGEKLGGVVPSLDGFMDLVGMGAKMSLGLGAANFVGQFASQIKSPIPVVSTRTLASGATTLALYFGYRKIPNAMVKDVLKYAAAGAAVHTAGSALYDVMAAIKWQPPQLVMYGINAMSGVMPIQVEGNMGAAETAGNGSADLNTQFA